MIKINGTKIRALRRSKQLTIQQLADQVGLSSSAIGMYERGMRTPDLETIYVLARYFSVEIDYFLEGNKNLFREEQLGENLNYRDKFISDEKVAISFVINQVLKRASGICELCNSMAPFISPNGQPYLETYMLKPESPEGNISAKNVVAVCPNCRKKLSILQLPGDITFLQNKIYGKD